MLRRSPSANEHLCLPMNFTVRELYDAISRAEPRAVGLHGAVHSDNPLKVYEMTFDPRLALGISPGTVPNNLL